MIDLSLRDIVTHPLSTASAVFTLVAATLNVPVVDALFGVAWANAGALFTVVSVTATTIAPRVPWLPAETLTVAAIFTGVLFVASRLNRLWDALKQRLKR